MVDSYEGQRVYFSDQNLQMDDEKTNKVDKEEAFKRFKYFIKEFQFSNNYIYR